MGWESDMRVAAQVGAEVEPEMDKCQIVRGVVERLQIAKGYEDFAFTQETKDAAGVLAVGAAAMGQAVNSTGLLVSSGGSAIDMQFYTCLVDGKRVVGRFHRVGFRDGDEVEFVCVQSGDNYAVAARDPNSRVIWTLPYHERGEQAQRRNAMKWMWIIAIAMGIFVTIFCWHITLSDPHDAPLWFFPVNFFVGIAIWLVIEYPGDSANGNARFFTGTCNCWHE